MNNLEEDSFITQVIYKIYERGENIKNISILLPEESWESTWPDLLIKFAHLISSDALEDYKFTIDTEILKKYVSLAAEEQREKFFKEKRNG